MGVAPPPWLVPACGRRILASSQHFFVQSFKKLKCCMLTSSSINPETNLQTFTLYCFKRLIIPQTFSLKFWLILQLFGWGIIKLQKIAFNKLQLMVNVSQKNEIEIFSSLCAVNGQQRGWTYDEFLVFEFIPRYSSKSKGSCLWWGWR